MKLHSDVLHVDQIYAATTARGMRGIEAIVSVHGSRVRRHAFDVYLTGTSSRRPNSSSGDYAHDGHAATWDEWGMFLSMLFDLDPNMIVGSSGSATYAGREHFHATTCQRYTTLTAPYQHGKMGHRWHWYRGGATCDCGAELDTSARAADYLADLVRVA